MSNVAQNVNGSPLPEFRGERLLREAKAGELAELLRELRAADPADLSLGGALVRGLAWIDGSDPVGAILSEAIGSLRVVADLYLDRECQQDQWLATFLMGVLHRLECASALHNITWREVTTSDGARRSDLEMTVRQAPLDEAAIRGIVAEELAAGAAEE